MSKSVFHFHRLLFGTLFLVELFGCLPCVRAAEALSAPKATPGGNASPASSAPIAVVQAVYFSSPVAPNADQTKQTARPLQAYAGESGMSFEIAQSPADFLVGKGQLLSQPEIQFSKLAIVFAKPVSGLTQIEIESCAADFRDGIEAFTFPNMRKFFAEGGFSKATLHFPAESSEIKIIDFVFRLNRGLCLKQLTLRNDKNVVMKIDLQEGATANVEDQASTSNTRESSFAKAGISPMLDSEIVPKSIDEGWIFRFRSDGTFFVFGDNDAVMGGAHFSAIGSFEISETLANSLRLKLTGVRFVTHGPWDGWYCGNSCGQRTVDGQTAVSEIIELQKLKTGGYFIRNRTEEKLRTIPFSDFPVRLKTL